MPKNTRLINTPSISSDVDLGSSKSIQAKNIYIVSREGFGVNAGMYFKQAFVYLKEDGLHRIYYRVVSGIRNLYFDDKFIIPIHGTLNDMIYVEPYTVLSIEEAGNISRLVVLDGREIVYDLSTLKKGFLSKKECRLKQVSLGLAGETLYAYSHTEGYAKCPDILVVGDRKNGFKTYEYENITPLGWSGEWYSTAEVENNRVNLYIYLYNGDVNRYELDKHLIGDQFLKQDTIFYFNPSNHMIIMNNELELKAINIEDGKVLWQKVFGGKIYTPIHSIHSDYVAVSVGKDLFILNALDGNIRFNTTLDGVISSISLSDQYLSVGVGEVLYIYSRERDVFNLYGKYMIPGKIVGLNAVGKYLLISYVTPSDMLRTLYINFDEKMTLEIEDVTLISNSATQIPIGDFRWEARLINSTSRYLDILKNEDKLAIVDKGSSPGSYSLSILLDIVNHLPTLIDLGVNVEGLKSSLKKIRLSFEPIYGTHGVYVPLSITTAIDLDELYAILASRENTVYGSTPVVRNVSKGETTIPLYIIWAKAGVHDVDLKIIGWSKRNRLYERFSSRIKFDRDIPPLYARIFADALHIWSPYELGETSILLKSDETQLAIKHYIARGWNEVELPGSPPNEVVIALPNNVRCVMRRGSSWIEFLKS